MYEATRKVFWTGVRIPPSPPKVTMGLIEILETLKHDKTIIGYHIDGDDVYVYHNVSIERIELNLVVSSDGDALGFDRANSKEVDNLSEKT